MNPTVDLPDGAAQPDLSSYVADLRLLAIRALRRMFLPEQNVFAFRVGRTSDGVRLEGISRRYTAITLIGLHTETQTVRNEVLDGRMPEEVCAGLIEAAERTDDIGEAALTLWTARLLQHADTARALARLKAMAPATRACPTVEFSWCLTALSVPSPAPGDGELADALAQRLLSSWRKNTALFPHWPDDAQPSALRSHIACFADLVYPIQALSYYHRLTGSPEALTAARRCAQTMCRLQGPEGQWWWHYDVRTGQVVEKYPVYAVHQDGMGPMALYALQEACGEEHPDAVRKSLLWLRHAPEIDGSLVDRQADVIWRKVARREPNKLSRRLQALASRVHPAVRAPGLNVLFPPVQIDYESRPYHMGWLLHAFPAGRVV